MWLWPSWQPFWRPSSWIRELQLQYIYHKWTVGVHYYEKGGGPRVVVSTAAFHARARGSVPGLGGLKETKMFLPHPRVKVSIMGSLRDREVACSASDRQGSNFESFVWRTVSSQSSHHPQEALLAQFSLYVHKGGLKPDSFHFITMRNVVLLDILRQMVQKSGFNMWLWPSWRPSWMSPLAQGFSLTIRLIFITEFLMM